MLGIAQNLGCCPLLDDLPGLHDRNSIGELGNHGKIMRYQNQAHIACAGQVAEQKQYLSLGNDVERGSRFIGDQQRRRQ